ncbi:AfsR/SARP family transcriptional regulator [Actinophytocola algeriensis]|uniref:DNA-binding SARP family transcriptional activator n=1 Tax=Actinophytocola algeriensis TaxID=1768010 RepID=A0A7W7QC83_9PSEU|nr:BTAD domain-containing putative transcriptional regulator [Actinophytocola algeriensis]MBB4910763.1 DNA-binding SARP family transcriptional activator [Actinophytocola algeriensis]MBE1473756.1 DNA-binding SARP family transcriptional activator [Actinophytocola algeriensis]
MGGTLRFEVLGPVRAWLGDTELDLGTPQQRAILGILLLRTGATATPDQLISAVWGPAAPRAAVGMIRSYVSRLRRVLPANVIESVGGGYALRTGSLDATDFGDHIAAARTATDPHTTGTHLRAALGLWRGTPLAGVNGEFAEIERTRLAKVRLSAIEDLAAADIDTGRHVEATAALEEVIAGQPLRERPRELLMLALYRAGRQADALAVFTEIRRLLDDELGLEPGPGLREMQRRILAADPGLRDHEPRHIPAQLPPDLPDFVGRADELAVITGALTPSGTQVPVVGIEGLAGVGKTTLAVHLGHTLTDRFPDGQLFADLTADPLPGLLRAVGVTDPPAAQAERAALWRTHTAGRRLLIVLDNARDADQLRHLVPGAGGAAVLITARRRIYGVPYIQWVRLQGLREDESRALFERLVGDRVRREPDAAHALVAGTAGLPQVIAALGSRIASRPEWTLDAARDRIGRPVPGAPVSRPECGAIESPYLSTLDDLTPEQVRAFRLLAVADGPDITLAAAAAVLDLPATDTALLLESLVDVHLLELGGVDRYYFHAPVRHFARGRAFVEDGPEASQAALTRLVRFYSAENGGVRAPA